MSIMKPEHRSSTQRMQLLARHQRTKSVLYYLLSQLHFRRISISQYKIHLNHFTVLVVPMSAMFCHTLLLKHQILRSAARYRKISQMYRKILSRMIQKRRKVRQVLKIRQENKTITISDTEFYAWIVQLNLYTDKYEGYTLHIHGTVYRNDYMEAKDFSYYVMKIVTNKFLCILCMKIICTMIIIDI